MKQFKRIAGINLLVLLGYSLFIRLINSPGQHGLQIVIESAFVVGLHVLVALIFTAVEYSNRRTEHGRAWAWSAGIILLVGFSTCLGNGALG
jgi:mannose/fructose/N-acetylgalactosamine-specific phosphotransferase system component IID